MAGALVVDAGNLAVTTREEVAMATTMEAVATITMAATTLEEEVTPGAEARSRASSREAPARRQPLLHGNVSGC